jgi:quercetin dioxygenase-like cupin family protein
MIKKNIERVEKADVAMEGVSGTQIQWLFGKDDGAPGFFLRRFVMAPGGTIPLHGHAWEHEIYVLKGHAEVFTDTETSSIAAGDALFIAPDEPHGYRNTGVEDLEFLCVVPASSVR